MGFKRAMMLRRAPRFRAFRIKTTRQYQTPGYYGRLKNGPEYKFFDLDIDDAVVAAGANIVQDSCNKIPQGVTEVTRVGRKCVIKKIGWKFQMILPTTAVATATTDICRVILYLDKQANGATATTTGILESDDFQSFNNLANKNRFRTLMDRTYQLKCPAGSGRGSTDTLSYGEDAIQDSFYKNCNIPLEFSATTGAITEITSNNIGVLILSGDGLVGFFSKMRLRFSDN